MISLRFKISQTSWRDLGNLVEMEDISPRSRQDLESCKHHGEISVISARSRQSRRDGRYLAGISRDLESKKDHGEISSRSHQSRRDLGKNFARV